MPRGGRGPKVIALSASDHQDAYAILSAGASEFVAKERAFNELSSAIERLFPPSTASSDSFADAERAELMHICTRSGLL